MNKLKFNRFTDVEHIPLRVYNRTVMFYNIYDDHGKLAAEEYADSFSKEERLQMAQVAALVKAKGTKHVIQLVTAGVQFVDDPYVESAQ
jgi:Zn-dependent oligopeptidase